MASNKHKTQYIVSVKYKPQHIVFNNCVKLMFSEIMNNCNTLRGHPGGLYKKSKIPLLSPQNIRQNKKPIIYNI